MKWDMETTDPARLQYEDALIRLAFQNMEVKRADGLTLEAEREENAEQTDVTFCTEKNPSRTRYQEASVKERRWQEQWSANLRYFSRMNRRVRWTTRQEKSSCA